jgi:hypothetical protein
MRLVTSRKWKRLPKTVYWIIVIEKRSQELALTMCRSAGRARHIIKLVTRTLSYSFGAKLGLDNFDVRMIKKHE